MNNRLHKVIFNKSTGLMIAVCETAHNNGKSSKDKRFQVALFSLSGSLKTDLTAKNNVNIIAAQNTQSEKARNESVGAHIGVAFDVQGGSAIGVNIGGNYGKGKANGEEVAYRNSHVGSTTGKTTISAGETLNIKGGQVAGKGVAITAKDMNIESLQDTMTYNSKQHNISADMTIGYGFSGSVSGGMSKINADYASVNEQSGIFAGDDGYQINVQNHTDLKGGLITSTAKAEQDGKNRFTTGTLTFADLANHAEYKGEAIGLGVSGSVKGDNPNNPNSVVADKTGMSSTMGYGKDSDKQYATTFAGINTANITIRDNEKQQQITGRTAEETKRAVKTDLTLENYAEHSGSLKNNFDKEKVQNEIDLQVKVTKEFRSNVQHFQAEQNKRLDELKEKKDKGEISEAEYKEQAEKIERQKLITNVVAGGLLSPADSLTGVAVSAVSPAVSYAVGQHFKKEGKEGSFEHIATHAVIGALTSAANGGNALSGAVSAGGAEALAPIVAKVLYGKDNSQNLTADEKETVVSVTTAISTITGGAIGDSSVNAYIGGTVATNAVENNYLFPPEQAEKDKLTARKYEILAKYQWDYETDAENPELIAEPTDAEKAELAKINAKLDYYEQESERRDKEFDRAYDDCRERAKCDRLYHLHVTQRKEWTDKGIEQFKQDLKNGKLSENWILEKDEKNMFHNFSDDGIEVLRNPDGTFVNAKYTHKNGQYEVIVNKQTGEIVMHPNNAGTFNYYANSDKYPGGNQIGHKDLDVDPWMDFGNGLGDRTTYWGRKRNGIYSSDNVWDKTKQFAIGEFFGEFGDTTTKGRNQRKKATEEFNKLDQKSSK